MYPYQTDLFQLFDFHSLIKPALIVLAIIFIAFLVFRAYALWYWKINEIVKLLKEISDSLKNKSKEEK